MKRSALKGTILANQTLSDHVVVFADALSTAHCEALIDRFESSPDQETCQRDQCYSFTQLDITKNWPEELWTTEPPESPTVAEDSGAKYRLSMEEPAEEESPV